MKVIIKRTCFVAGKPIEPNKDGKPVNMKDSVAKSLIAAKKAVAVTDQAAKK